MQIVLYTPEIPPNTGSVARTCAATCTPLHLIEPLGFSLEDKYLKRAGLDYWPHVDLTVWPELDLYTDKFPDTRLVMTSARGGTAYHEFAFKPGDALVFGPETTGLPPEVLAKSEHCVRMPIWGHVRSINLSNAVTTLLYEAYRQTGGLDGK